MTFLDHIGHWLALTAKGIGKGALWVSQHPQVVSTIASILPVSQQVKTDINAGESIAGQVLPKS